MAKDPYRYFRIEAAELLQQLSRAALDLEKDGTGGAAMRLLRLAHTLKGAARVVRVAGIADLAHEVEEVLGPHREGGAVPRDKVDRVLAALDAMSAMLAKLSQPESVTLPATLPNAEQAAKPAQQAAAEAPRLARADVAEVATLLEGLGEIGNELETLRRVDSDIDRLRGISRQLGLQARAHTLAPARIDALAGELQSVTEQVERTLQQGTDRARRELGATRDAAQRLRLMPVSDIFHALERTARDAAHALGKEVVFDAQDSDVRIEGAVLDAVQSALIQLVRNAVAHGIEAPAARAAAGKPVQGKIVVSVTRRGYDAHFTCRDDGAGLDTAAVRRALAARGLAPEADDAALFQHLLAGGASTSGAVSEIAGRGIGLNLVREALRQFNGSVTAESTPGQGMGVTLAVPLSLAALQVLLLESDGGILALPLDTVLCTLRLASGAIVHQVEGDAIVHQGEQVLLLHLSDATMARKAFTVILVRQREGRLALAVERLAGLERVVLQPLPALAPADTTVLGLYLDLEGNPRLVLDPEHFDARRHRRMLAAPARDRKPILIVDDSLTTRMLESSILESAGYTVEMAASAEEGLAMAEKQSYALFLVDVEMPGMDGFEFVQRTRADPRLGATPCILVSSRNAAADFARGREAGAADYIVKGEFDQARFLQRVAELVQSSWGQP